MSKPNEKRSRQVTKAFFRNNHIEWRAQVTFRAYGIDLDPGEFNEQEIVNALAAVARFGMEYREEK